MAFLLVESVERPELSSARRDRLEFGLHAVHPLQEGGVNLLDRVCVRRPKLRAGHAELCEHLRPKIQMTKS